MAFKILIVIVISELLLSANHWWLPTRQSCDCFQKIVGFLPFTFGCNCL